MADVNQTMQLTLSAKDEASEVLKRVHGELEKLGAGVSLADLSKSLDAVSSHLQAVEHAGSGLVGQLHDLTRGGRRRSRCLQARPRRHRSV
jgi:hypothetical protein